jgi:hypothetical protein
VDTRTRIAIYREGSYKDEKKLIYKLLEKNRKEKEELLEVAILIYSAASCLKTWNNTL